MGLPFSFQKISKDFKAILIILILILIVFSIVLYSFIRSESLKCMSNPYIYATQKLDEGLGQTKCECTTQTNESMLFFSFNGSYLWAKDMRRINDLVNNLNFTLVK